MNGKAQPRLHLKCLGYSHYFPNLRKEEVTHSKRQSGGDNAEVMVRSANTGLVVL